jgi:hypothetical protein
MSTISKIGGDFLRRLSDPEFSKNFNVRGDGKGGINTLYRSTKVNESKLEKDKAMSDASKVIAKFISQTDVANVEGVNPGVITDNLVVLRERMLTNATSRKAQTNIESNMNRAIGALNPSVGDHIISAVGTLFKIVLMGRGAL